MLHTVKFHISTEQAKKNYINVFIEIMKLPAFATVKDVKKTQNCECISAGWAIRERQL